MDAIETFASFIHPKPFLANISQHQINTDNRSRRAVHIHVAYVKDNESGIGTGLRLASTILDIRSIKVRASHTSANIDP